MKKLNEDDYTSTREDETAMLDFREKRGIKRHQGQEDDSGCLGTVRLVSSVSPQLVGCYGFDACLGKPLNKLRCLRKKYYCVGTFHIFCQFRNGSFLVAREYAGCDVILDRKWLSYKFLENLRKINCYEKLYKADVCLQKVQGFIMCIFWLIQGSVTEHTLGDF